MKKVNHIKSDTLSLELEKKEENLKLKNLKLMTVNSHLVWAFEKVSVKVKAVERVKVLTTESVHNNESGLNPELDFHDDIFNSTDESQNVYEM